MTEPPVSEAMPEDALPFELALHVDFRDNQAELLHALLQSSDYGVLVSGLDRRDILANRRLGELFTMPARQVVDDDPQHVRALARARVRNPEEFETNLQRTYADPTLSYIDEITLATDPPRFLRRATGPIYNRDREPVARLWTFLDITQTRALQIEVEQQLTNRVADHRAATLALRAMNALCRDTLQHETMETLLAAIVGHLRGLGGCDSACVLLREQKKGWAGAAAGPRRAVEPVSLTSPEEALLTDIVQTITATQPPQRVEADGGPLSRLLGGAALIVPLVRDKQTVGLLGVAIDRHWDADSVRNIHLPALADQTAFALETFRLHAELRGAVFTLQATQARMVEMEKLHTAGLLASSVAHDIRNIVTTMQLELDGLPPSATEGMAEQLTRFSALTHRLLAFARPGILEMRPTQMAKVIGRVVPLILAQAEINGVTIVADVSLDLPVVNADGSQLENLFVNLCLNAIQEMASRGGCLLMQAVQSGEWIEIHVDDDGGGIAPEVLPRLFEPFFTTRANGTGLGLPSCKRIVEQHGGEIIAANRAQGGARFTISLPIMH